MTSSEKLKLSRAVVVEGRDDVDAVSRACDALIIPTHGFGITEETWKVLEKADAGKGLIILTDPDHAGETIRKRITERFPGSIQCYIAREDALDGSDIGVENAKPEVIASALRRALDLAGKAVCESEGPDRPVTAADISELGLSGAEGAAELRARVCAELGIGWCNAGALVKRLRGFGIGADEFRETVRKIKENI